MPRPLVSACATGLAHAADHGEEPWKGPVGAATGGSDRSAAGGIAESRPWRLAGESTACQDSRAEAIWRLSKKLDVMELARMIGHRDLKSLLFYYDADPDELADRLG